MMYIEEFIDSLYRGVNGSKKEIQEFKEEMRIHLTETVNELKSQGKTEEESLKIAYERFGDSNLIHKGLFKLFNRQKKFTRIILICSVLFLLIGVISYLVMSQKDLKFQSEQHVLTREVLQSIGNKESINNSTKLQLKDLVKKYKYINYIALFKVDDNSKLQKTLKEDTMSMYGTYRYPFDIKSAKIIYPDNAKQLTTPDGYDRSTVVATNGRWIVQYEYKKYIYRYI
ncbi:hypothetical protein KM803_08885 [Clostridium tyrobutyricum]|uniref:permease prefix domain 1-containing protein n=1 Tax=Clostridium tyrobutyricum TaxID=1519 RepID=UPI001C395988|nr:permease prefix domain 1-containing protein [Clostridium tyrobutyricum]MBV4417221.1 hypothetical protein [Clostridium tyrobutyricum]MBV4421713.1 hypothetical protein [Clostridium tyrobutyricum]MBV4431451.1 hypothetical protein [Clostridium tyrobutyricum]MBV4439811.1 hypothetical protein [Clostridium tyrobutyricum]